MELAVFDEPNCSVASFVGVAEGARGVAEQLETWRGELSINTSDNIGRSSRFWISATGGMPIIDREPYGSLRC